MQHETYCKCHAPHCFAAGDQHADWLWFQYRDIISLVCHTALPLPDELLRYIAHLTVSARMTWCVRVFDDVCGKPCFSRGLFVFNFMLTRYNAFVKRLRGLCCVGDRHVKREQIYGGFLTLEEDLVRSVQPASATDLYIDSQCALDMLVKRVPVNDTVIWIQYYTEDLTSDSDDSHIDDGDDDVFPI